MLVIPEVVRWEEVTDGSPQVRPARPAYVVEFQVNVGLIQTVEDTQRITTEVLL